MPTGRAALLIAALAVAAPLATAVPAQADYKVRFSNPPPAPPPGNFKPLFDRRALAARRVIVVQQPVVVPVLVEPPAPPKVNRPERPRLHEAPSGAGEEGEAAAAPAVTVLRPIGQQIFVLDQQ